MEDFVVFMKGDKVRDMWGNTGLVTDVPKNPPADGKYFVAVKNDKTGEVDLAPAQWLTKTNDVTLN